MGAGLCSLLTQLVTVDDGGTKPLQFLAHVGLATGDAPRQANSVWSCRQVGLGLNTHTEQAPATDDQGVPQFTLFPNTQFILFPSTQFILFPSTSDLTPYDMIQT